MNNTFRSIFRSTLFPKVESCKVFFFFFFKHIFALFNPLESQKSIAKGCLLPALWQSRLDHFCSCCAWRLPVPAPWRAWEWTTPSEPSMVGWLDDPKHIKSIQFFVRYLALGCVSHPKRGIILQQQLFWGKATNTI